MIAASLALMDEPEHSKLANAIYANATRDIAASLTVSFGPDGAWPEGPNYWGYAVKYALVAIAMLNSAQGSARGLDMAPGLNQTGLWRVHNTSPLNEQFNWGDSDAAADIDVSNFMGLARQVGA